MKPILFNTEMVLDILEGRKTVTRRPVKFGRGQNPKWSGYVPDGGVLYGSNNIPAAKAPYQVGDILWVRETWAAWSPTYGTVPRLIYKVDGDAPAGVKWRPSIHMPREAARLFLRVVAVWVERLKDITPEQIDAEGCKEWAYSAITGEPLPSGPSWFRIAWDRTIKPSDLPAYGWEANPWVWVIKFERISRPPEVSP